LPLFERLNERVVIEGALVDSMVIRPHVGGVYVSASFTAGASVVLSRFIDALIVRNENI
jgi:hypothetical protein